METRAAYGFYDRYSNKYLMEVLADDMDQACSKVDHMSLTELVIHTAGTLWTIDSFQYAVRNARVVRFTSRGA